MFIENSRSPEDKVAVINWWKDNNKNNETFIFLKKNDK